MNLLSVLLLNGGAVPQLSLSGIVSRLSQTFNFESDRPRIGYQFRSDGVAEFLTDDTGDLIQWTEIAGNYLQNSSDGSQYELRVQQVSADTGGTLALSNIALNTWQALTLDRNLLWTKDNNNIGVVNLVITVEIREIARPTNIVTASNITLSCEVSA